MKIIILLLLKLLIIFNISAQRKPFPQHVKYPGNHNSLSKYSQTELDGITMRFYANWKTAYLKKGCGADRYYIHTDMDYAITVSEAIGYGMIITAYMAGYDPNARETFDGLYKFSRDYPSPFNANLMAWCVVEGCTDDGKPSAASDGDIDIAYGLLLADIQWGSEGEINYYDEAKKIINASHNYLINTRTNTVKLGDWATSTNWAYNSTRPSDFILDHFRVFKCSSGNIVWDKVVDKCYSILNEMQSKYSPQTGLVPDFVINVNTTAKPAGPNFLESDFDGDYYYNSCRVPWRIGTDYLISGDERGKAVVKKINEWLVINTNGDPENIGSQYYLDGSPGPSFNYQTNSFIAPFAVGAMIDTDNPDWYDAIFKKVANSRVYEDGYFGNTIKMICLIVMSENYWLPDCSTLHIGDTPSTTSKKMFTLIQNKKQIQLRLNSQGKSNNLAEMSVYNLNGKQIYKTNFNKQIELNMAERMPGCYIIKVKDLKTGQVQTQKIIL